MKNAQTYWDKVAPKYAKSPVKDEASYQKKLALTQEYFQPDWTIFEFGCGTGTTALIHAPRVKQIVATDISDRMLDIARGKARDAGVDNVTFVNASLVSSRWEAESFDAVLALSVLHLLDDLDEALERVNQLLKPGGIFVSNTALIGELGSPMRGLIRAMQWMSVAPPLNRFGLHELELAIARCGFDIRYQWLPNPHTAFIIARKRGATE